jgi:hypothetical protein
MTQQGIAVETSRDVLAALWERWPGWSLTFTQLGGVPERICLDSKTIYVDTEHWPEGCWFAGVHAIAHLDWGHMDGDEPCFTEEQEALADWVAKVKLDIRE